MDKSKFEVLVVDSMSGDSTPSVVDEFSKKNGFEVTLLNCPDNVLSAKRNYGMIHAKREYVIFLDDDCIPESDHVESFLAAASKSSKEKVLWCGGVQFDSLLVKRSNYYRYRNECHFSRNRLQTTALRFNQVVTMNMMVNREYAIGNKLFFDEKFVGYGCEDVEYGWRAMQLGFKIQPCNADILHDEVNGSIEKFKKKIFYASRDGFSILKIVAPGAIANMGMTSLLEPITIKIPLIARLSRFFLKLILKSPLPRVIERILVRTDHISTLYSRVAFRFVLAAAHLDGASNRTIGSKISLESAKSEGWYG